MLLLCNIIIGIAIVGAAIHFKNNINKIKYKMSIRESLDLVGLPIITLKNNSTKLNFLLDSGSTHSHISSDSASKIKGVREAQDQPYTACAAEGHIKESIKANLCYKDKIFKINFCVNEGLTKSFRDIKKDEGIDLHGILGNDFLRKYKYIIDFKELIVYNN